MIKKWKTLKKKDLIKNKWINVVQETVKLHNNKIYDDYYVLNYSDWVLAIVQNETNDFLICKQFRNGSKKISHEFVGGVVDPDETPLKTVKRELKEEIGYTGGNFRKIGKLSPNPSTNTNLIHIFHVTNGKITDSQKLDPTEQIDFMWVSQKDLKKLIKTNKFFHALHLSALYLMDF